MSTERQSAYHWLVNALLSCPSRDTEILQANQSLLDAGLVRTMLTVAETLANQGNCNSANWLRNRATQLVTGMGKSLSTITTEAEADQLLQQGIKQHQISRFQAALQSWQQALTVYRKIGSREGEGNSLCNLGIAFRSLGQYHQATECLEQSLNIAREIGNYQLEAKSVSNLGAVLNSSGQYLQAIEFHQQSLTIARETGDRSLEANSLCNLGNAYQSLGQYQQAIEYHQQSLTITREIGDRSLEANSLGNLGNAYHSLGEYQQAINYQQQSLLIDQQLGNRFGEAASLANLGRAFHYLGQYHQAIEYHQQSLTIAQEIGDRPLEASSLVNLGNACDSLGQYQQAINYHQHCLNIAREISNQPLEASSLGSLGNVYYSLGQCQQAIKYYHQQLNIARSIGDAEGEAKSLGNLGLAFDALGEYSLAIRYHQQSLTLARKISARQWESNSQCHMGNAFLALGQYSLARNCYQQSLSTTREIGDIRGEAASLSGLGNTFYFLGQYQLALEYHQQSLTIAREIGDCLGEGAFLNNLGLILLESGHLREAEDTLRTGIQIWESLRLGLENAHKISIFETQDRTYRRLQEVLIAQNKIDDALEIAERGRARAFVELLAEQLSPQSVAQFTSNPPTLHKILQIAQEQNFTIVEYSIIHDVLGQESKLFIWVIKPTGEIAFRPVEIKLLRQEQNTSLNDLVLQVRSSLNIKEKLRNAPAVSNSKASQLLQQLYQYLIQPIANLLPADPNAPVIFIPQDSLFLVPFPALQDATGKFLIEQHTIVTAPSIQTLDLTRQQRQRVGTIHKSLLQNQDVLVVGNPTMPTIPLVDPPERLNPLPGAETEAKAIASLFNSQAIIGNKATKVDIVQQMPKARLIHLATHGLLDDIRQLGVPGAIALAPSDEDNGFLTAGEILEMKLNAELVVLSACSSGQGKITGDGVIGLSRSLFAAGIPSVIVSLWKVKDYSTQFLMTEFYQNLQSGLSKAQALRQAMLTTMKKKRYSRPKSWAGFTLVGEAE